MGLIVQKDVSENSFPCLFKREIRVKNLGTDTLLKILGNLIWDSGHSIAFMFFLASALNSVFAQFLIQKCMTQFQHQNI